jgi:DNA polymerase I
MVIQGTAADIMKVAMVRCDKAIKAAGLQSRMVLQIHDELLFEGPEAEAEQVKQIACGQMGAAFEMDPPLAVEAGIGPDWLAAK